MAKLPAPIQKAVESARLRILRRIENALEMPMVVLGLIWLVLLILELTYGLSPLLENITTAIWVLFILDFLLKFTIAPHKWQFIRRNWLNIIALALPALRVLRFVRAVTLLRAARATRGLRLVRIVGSVNRGMQSLRRTMSRRGFGYVLGITIMITFAGAAGIYALEKDTNPSPMMQDFGSALWWTAMMMTTMGSEGWPQTTEGRVLCLLLAVYAFAVFGYVTATIATFFIGRDKEAQATPLTAQAVDALRGEIAALRRQMQERPTKPSP